MKENSTEAGTVNGIRNRPRTGHWPNVAKSRDIRTGHQSVADLVEKVVIGATNGSGYLSINIC